MLDASSDLQIYVNNLKTGAWTSNSMIPVSVVFDTTYLGVLDTTQITDGTVAITLDTAAGFVTVTITKGETDYSVEYSTILDTATLQADEIEFVSSSVRMTAEAMENILGYDVEIYDEFINIITDNKDIFSSEEQYLDYYETTSVIDNSRNVQSVDELDPTNPIPTPVKPSETTIVTTAAEPEVIETSRTSSDEKYTLAASDIENADGTYTQTEFDPDIVKNYRDDLDMDYMERMSERFKAEEAISNPSKIPYSQITIENAAEAFPFLGYCGYVPDYIEVLPSDSENTIKSKMYDNLIGADPASWGILAQYHQYTSEEDYLAAVAQAEAERAERNAAEAADIAMMKETGNTIWDATDEGIQALREKYADKFGW